MPSVCPQHKELANYLVGELGTDRCEQLDAHLLECESCQALLQTVVTQSDTFLLRLCQPVAVGAAVGVVEGEAEPRENVLQEPELQDAIMRVRRLTRDSCETIHKDLASTVSEPIPDQIGPYRILAKLGQGGMGTVFKALHTKLDHPNIVRATDANQHDGRHYLVMEFVDGCELGEVVRRHGPLPITEACEVARQVAIGLQCAHQHGLVHRDIKPSNIMLTYLQTPVGVVRIEINDPDIHVVLDQTGATFRGIDRHHEVKVRAGEHGLTITRHDWTFDTDKFVLHRGETTRLDVQILNGEVHVLRDGGLLNRRPLPSEDSGERPDPASQADPIPATRVAPPAPPSVNDYDAFATGRWIPVLTSSGPHVSRRNATISDGIIEVQDGHAYDPSVKASDAIVRAQVRRSSGQNVMLTVRDVLGVYYSAFYVNDGNEAVGIGMRGVRFRYGVKRQFAASTGVKDGEFFELACSAIGEVLTIYVNGQEVGQLVDRDIARAGGFAVHATRGQGTFRDVEVMVLDQSPH